jgi:4-hydroxy-2-oxoheptanedioate aldolase
MQGKELAAALHRGDRVYATCITSPSAKWPPMVAGLGLDFVFIDTEHIPLGRETVAWMCQAYKALGLPPIVRVPKPDPYQACVALDGGANGVIFPYVESVEEVRALRGAVKLRPLKGRRLQRALSGEEKLDAVTAEYLARGNENNVMIVNIESQAALDALDDILAVPGVDALLIGPHDLSINLGVPEQYDNPKFLEAVSLVFRKARAAGVGAGVHFSWGMDPQIAWAREGANLIIHSSDFKAVGDALGADFRHLRETLGDARSAVTTPEEAI